MSQDNAVGLFDHDDVPIPASRLAAWSSGIIAFGFALGTYAGLADAMRAAGKTPLVFLRLVRITILTLAVLIPLTGGSFSVRRATYLVLLTTAYLGALLLALAPVMWLFAASSWYLGWRVVVAVGLGAVSLLVAGYRVVQPAPSERKAYVLWALLLIPVTLQMATTLRPVVTPLAPEGSSRMFFLEHFGKVSGFRLPDGSEEHTTTE